MGSAPVCQLAPHWFSESGAGLHSPCHAEQFPTPGDLGLMCFAPSLAMTSCPSSDKGDFYSSELLLSPAWEVRSYSLVLEPAPWHPPLIATKPLFRHGRLARKETKSLLLRTIATEPTALSLNFCSMAEVLPSAGRSPSCQL